MQEPRRRVLVWALAYGVGHHLGLLPDGLGDAGGGTRWADWLGLLVPAAVVGTALAALAAVGTDRRGWALAAAGGLLYAQGHGLNLAANSIGNARGTAAPVALWDEAVGHLLWYGGVALLVAALARAHAADPRPAGPLALVVALLTGLTWATNSLGAGGVELLGALGALALAGYGVALRRSAAGRLLVVAYLPAAALVLLLAL